LDRGACPDGKSHHDSTPLYAAACFEREAVVRLLLERGASVDKQFPARRPFLDARRASRCSRLDKRRGTPRRPGEDETITPLYVAALRGSVPILQLLLDGGASIDSPAKDGWTALAIASKEGHLPAVRCLLDRGAETAKPRMIPKCLDRSVMPLHLACQERRVLVVRQLLLRDKRGPASVDRLTCPGVRECLPKTLLEIFHSYFTFIVRMHVIGPKNEHPSRRIADLARSIASYLVPYRAGKVLLRCRSREGHPSGSPRT